MRRHGVGRVTVVNARFVKPLDTALIAEVAKRVKCLMTIEEAFDELEAAVFEPQSKR